MAKHAKEGDRIRMAERTVVEKVPGKWLLGIVLTSEKLHQPELFGFPQIDSRYGAWPVFKDFLPMTPHFVKRRNRRIEVSAQHALHENELVQTRNRARDSLQKRLHVGEHNIGTSCTSDVSKMRVVQANWSTPSCLACFNVVGRRIEIWRITIDEEGPNHRCHRPGRFISGRVFVGKRLRGLWNHSPIEFLQYRSNRSYLPGPACSQFPPAARVWRSE